MASPFTWRPVPQELTPWTGDFLFHHTDLEWEFDPAVGNVGRGYRALMPAMIHGLELYKPYETPGENGDSCDIPIVGDPGWVWSGYVREENGRHYIIAFERRGAKPPR